MQPRIAPPKRHLDQLDRHIEAQQALADAITRIVDDAEKAGWSKQEAMAAVIALAENMALQEADLKEINDFLTGYLSRLE